VGAQRIAPRSLLFVPGHRESMLAKAATLPADAIVFDLEDSVPLAEKAAARERVGTTLARWSSDGPAPYIRIRPPALGVVAEDIRVVLSHPSVGVIVPKVDWPDELGAVIDLLGNERDVIVNIETPRSLLHAEAFADLDGVTGLFLGGEDFTNAIGARRTAQGHELAWPRYLVLVAARAAGVAAYDTICPEFRDLDVLAADCRTAAEAGYDGKFAIHPAQIPAIHAAFTPSTEDTERAQRIVDAYDSAVARGEGAVAVDGQMVDPPVAERARSILRRAQRPA
jgi:citrate lyase subunit beta/citryl-CoA lyase